MAEPTWDETEPSWDDTTEASVEVSAPVEEGTSFGSKLGSLILGGTQGTTAGFGDELAGLTGASIESIMADDKKPFIERYREALAFSRNLNQKSREANPKSFFAGELGGSIASSLPTGPAGASIKGATGLGALFGLGGSNADLTKGEYGQAAKDAAITGALSGATAGLVKGLTNAPMLKENAARSFLKVSGATPRELAETELRQSGSDLLRKAQIALDDGVMSTFSSPKTMLERAEKLASKGGQSMGGILERAGKGANEINPDDLARQVKNLVSDFEKRAPSHAPKLRSVQNIMGDIKASGVSEVPLQGGGGAMLGKRNISLQEAQALKGSFDDLAKWNKLGDLPENAFAADKYREASGIVKKAIDKQVQQKLGSEAFGDLQYARDQFGAGKEIGSFMDRLSGKQNTASRSPNMLGKFGKVVDAVAEPVLRTANQAKITGTNKLANMMQKAPQSIPLSASTIGALQNALGRGESAFSAANHVLQQQDPKFREYMKTLNENESEGL